MNDEQKKTITNAMIFIICDQNSIIRKFLKLLLTFKNEKFRLILIFEQAKLYFNY